MKAHQAVDIDLLAPAIGEALIRKGWTQQHLAQASGISQASISDYLSHKKTPRHTTTRKLLDALGLSWRDIGIDIPESPSASAEKRDRPDGRMAVSHNIVLIPRNGSASAGPGQVNPEEAPEYDAYPRFEMQRLTGANPDHLRSLVVVGDSLAPEIIPNTRIIYLPVERFSGDGLYVVTVDDTEIVKRVQILPGGRLRFLPINPDYQPVELKPLAYPEASDTPNTYRVVENDDLSIIRPRGKVVFYPKPA